MEAINPVMPADWIIPDWPAPSGVRALITTRNGGYSSGAYQGAQGSGGMNLGSHCGDDAQHVARNREYLASFLPSPVRWLQQVHGWRVIDFDEADDEVSWQADAAKTTQAHVVCAVQSADCLPVLFCDQCASVVAAAHAGWRGLANGVLEASVNALGKNPQEVLAYLGPAIGPECFTVGADVFNAFVIPDPGTQDYFVKLDSATHPSKWLADLYGLARHRLAACGVTRVYGQARCTMSEAQHFYSYRRDRITGRMAALIWLENYSINH